MLSISSLKDSINEGYKSVRSSLRPSDPLLPKLPAQRVVFNLRPLNKSIRCQQRRTRHRVLQRCAERVPPHTKSRKERATVAHAHVRARDEEERAGVRGVPHDSVQPAGLQRVILAEGERKCEAVAQLAVAVNADGASCEHEEVADGEGEGDAQPAADCEDGV